MKGILDLSIGEGRRIDDASFAVPGPLHQADHGFGFGIGSENDLMPLMKAQPSHAAHAVRCFQGGDQLIRVQRGCGFDGVLEQVNGFV